MIDLDTFADDLGVTVIEGSVPDRWWGYYTHDYRLIVLRRGLGAAQRRTVLAHELGHAYYGHTGTIPSWERQADAFALELLLPAELVNKAEQFCTTIGELAAELDVTPALLRQHYQIRHQRRV